MKTGLIRIISTIYFRLFSFKKVQKFNLFLNGLTLRAMGFNNCCDMKKSGEYYFIKRYLNKAKLSLDIGANKGEYASLILENTESKVISFEPNKSCNCHLEKIVEKYPNRFVFKNILLLDNFDKVKFYHSSDCGGLSTASAKANKISYVHDRNQKLSMLHAATLDSIVDEIKTFGSRLDLLKIDVEGLEKKVLLGSSLLLKELRPRFIQIEFNLHQLYTGNTMIVFNDLLPEYDIYRLLGYSKGMIKVESHSPISNIFAYSNYIFVHKSEQMN